MCSLGLCTNPQSPPEFQVSAAHVDILFAASLVVGFRIKSEEESHLRLHNKMVTYLCSLLQTGQCL